MNHKPNCSLNIACAVYHTDGKCPGFKECDCSPKEEPTKVSLDTSQQGDWFPKPQEYRNSALKLNMDHADMWGEQISEEKRIKIAAECYNCDGFGVVNIGGRIRKCPLSWHTPKAEKETCTMKCADNKYCSCPKPDSEKGLAYCLMHKKYGCQCFLDSGDWVRISPKAEESWEIKLEKLFYDTPLLSDNDVVKAAVISQKRMESIRAVFRQAIATAVEKEQEKNWMIIKKLTEFHNEAMQDIKNKLTNSK